MKRREDIELERIMTGPQAERARASVIRDLARANEQLVVKGEMILRDMLMDRHTLDEIDCYLR